MGTTKTVQRLNDAVDALEKSTKRVVTMMRKSINELEQQGEDESEEEQVKKPRKKRAKKEVDPNAPKRPTTAYIAYQKEAIADYRADHPDVSYHDAQVAVGAQWRMLSTEEKSVWQESYEEEKQAYDVELEEYKKKKAREELVGSSKNADIPKGSTSKSSSSKKQSSSKKKKKDGVVVQPDIEVGEEDEEFDQLASQQVTRGYSASDEDEDSNEDSDSSDSTEETSDIPTPSRKR